MRSIIGDEELNCRVRNGTGCTLLSMDTSKDLFFRTVPGGRISREVSLKEPIDIEMGGKEERSKSIDLLVLVS